jgi:phospholipase/carboxylesterase
MFPIAMAREAQAVLSANGAKVTYREVADLSHTYPRKVNAVLLTWLNGGAEGFA